MCAHASLRRGPISAANINNEIISSRKTRKKTTLSYDVKQRERISLVGLEGGREGVWGGGWLVLPERHWGGPQTGVTSWWRSTETGTKDCETPQLSVHAAQTERRRHWWNLTSVPARHISEGSAPCPYCLAPCPIYTVPGRIEKQNKIFTYFFLHK